MKVVMVSIFGFFLYMFNNKNFKKLNKDEKKIDIW